MNFPHYNHACAKFENQHGDTMIIVIGGKRSNKTEIFDGLTWREVEDFPFNDYFWDFRTAVTYLDSIIYSAYEGNANSTDHYIVKYNITENQWEQKPTYGDTTGRIVIQSLVPSEFCKKVENDNNAPKVQEEE